VAVKLTLHCCPALTGRCRDTEESFRQESTPFDIDDIDNSKQHGLNRFGHSDDTKYCPHRAN
jgi:hypothetical protein